jgi:ABC-2 type transport system permease protein
MTTNLEFQKVHEWSGLRGFANLLHKENRSWWGSHRWWINALLWTGMLGGLVFIMLFILPSVAEATGDPNVAAAGGAIPFALEMGRSVFFELGAMALAVGVIILFQDLIVDEKQSGVTEWLLSKPVQRKAYILAKLVASLTAILFLLILLPGAAAYGLFFLRTGQPYPLLLFLSGVGILALHSLFYLTLTIFLGVLFTTRSLILGIALGSLLGGNILAGLIKPLVVITPWILGKTSSLVAAGLPVPGELLWAPIVSTALWCIIFVLIAASKFEKTEF